MEKLFSVLGASVVVVIIFILSPLVLLWSINTLSEHSNSALYIPHGIWTYLACYGLFLTLRGSSSK